MRSKVSRQTLLVEGKPACTECGIRPQRWNGGRWQSLCKVCHAANMRDFRARGKAEGRRLEWVTPEEMALVEATRRYREGGATC